MARPDFAVRFGFARWLHHLRTGAAPTHAEIAREVNRTGPAVSAWLTEAEAPIDYRVHAPLARFLEIDEAWLIKGAGAPPRPELWAAWLDARKASGPAPLSRVRDIPVEAMERVGSAKKATPKKRANGR